MKRVFFTVLLSSMVAACSDSDYLAKAGDHKITQQEFSAYLKMKGIKSGDDAVVLKDLANRIALTDSIGDQSLLDKNEIEAAVADYRRNLMISKYFDQYMASHVTDDAVKNYFSNHASDFEEERAHIAHILVRTNSSMSEEEMQQAKTRIYEAYSKLKEGKDFADLAVSYSSDTLSSKNGGDLGWLKRGSISPVFSEVAFSLESGAYSEPLQTEFGYHIVKAIESPKVIKKSFDDVKGEIRHMLKAQAKQAELDRLLSLKEIAINSGK